MTRAFVTKPVEAEPGVGEVLRKRREEAGHTIEELAAQTRIQPRFLRALEEGEWKELPEDVYVKSFVRSVARALGADPDAYLEKVASELKIARGLGYRSRQAVGPPRAVREPLLITPLRLRRAGAFILLLAVMAAFGYELRAIRKPPALFLSAPVDNMMTAESTITVAGETEPETILNINGEQTAPGSAGAFKATVALEPGVNVITVTAKKRRSNASTIIRRVVYEPPPALIPTSTP